MSSANPIPPPTLQHSPRVVSCRFIYKGANLGASPDQLRSFLHPAGHPPANNASYPGKQLEPLTIAIPQTLQSWVNYKYYRMGQREERSSQGPSKYDGIEYS